MIRVFSGQTADDVWRQAMSALTKDDDCSLQQSRLGIMREILHANLYIENPRERWVTSRMPAINPAFAIAEVFWILAGSNEASFINFWNPTLPKFSGHCERYHGAYGHRIRKQFGMDQLESSFKTLKNNPTSRQSVIQIWDPKTDSPTENGSPASSDIPCNICSMLKVRDGKLEWMQIMRSNDLYRGTPYNIVQFTMLQEILAGWLGLEIGAYCQLSDSLHIYECDFKELDSRILQTPCKNNDNLAIDKEYFDKLYKILWGKMLALSKNVLSVEEFYQIVEPENIPKSYNNLLLTVAADSARRRKYFKEMDFAIDKCTNPLLASLWKSWVDRWNK